MIICFENVDGQEFLRIAGQYDYILVEPQLNFSDYLNILKEAGKTEEFIAVIGFMESVDSNKNQTIRDSKRVLERIILSINYNEGPGLGNSKEGVTLIIGEKPGKFKEGHGLKEHYGCFASDIGSSLWLSRQLNSINADEKDFYWVNALTVYGEEVDPDFVEFLKPSKIITLGNIAHRWAEKHNLEHFVAPHPAFWKRFHNKEVYPLLKIIKEN